jgi:hypothetical protein
LHGSRHRQSISYQKFEFHSENLKDWIENDLSRKIKIPDLFRVERRNVVIILLTVGPLLFFSERLRRAHLLGCYFQKKTKKENCTMPHGPTSQIIQIPLRGTGTRFELSRLAV